jgi:hypothetical protein
MCAIVHEWVHAIYAHCDSNIHQINGKFRISWINVSPLCGISRMSYHSGILLSVSICAIAIILTSYCLQTNASNEE